MSSILLFNIGFRCENICEELKQYEKSNQFNLIILEDSKNIIIDCFKIKESYAESLSHNDFAIGDFYPLIFRAFPEKNIDAIIIVLKEICSTLDNISKGSTNADIKEAFAFFNTLSSLCLSYEEQSKAQSKIHLA